MSEYEEQAERFLKKYKARIQLSEPEVVDRFPGDEKATGLRYAYKVTLHREGKQYTFPFYDSIANYRDDKRPSHYDILSCLESSPVYANDVWEFAAEYGYKIDSKASYMRVTKIFQDCKNMHSRLLRMFGQHGLEELQDIC